MTTDPFTQLVDEWCERHPDVDPARLERQLIGESEPLRAAGITIAEPPAPTSTPRNRAERRAAARGRRQ